MRCCRRSSSFFATYQFVAVFLAVPMKRIVVFSTTSASPVVAVYKRLIKTRCQGAAILHGAKSKNRAKQVHRNVIMMTLVNRRNTYLLKNSALLQKSLKTPLRIRYRSPKNPLPNWRNILRTIHVQKLCVITQGQSLPWTKNSNEI